MPPKLFVASDGKAGGFSLKEPLIARASESKKKREAKETMPKKRRRAKRNKLLD